MAKKAPKRPRKPLSPDEAERFHNAKKVLLSRLTEADGDDLYAVTHAYERLAKLDRKLNG